MNHYPIISKRIQEKYPDIYDRMPLFKAVGESFSEDILVDDPFI